MCSLSIADSSHKSHSYRVLPQQLPQTRDLSMADSSRRCHAAHFEGPYRDEGSHVGLVEMIQNKTDLPFAPNKELAQKCGLSMNESSHLCHILRFLPNRSLLNRRPERDCLQPPVSYLQAAPEKDVPQTRGLSMTDSSHKCDEGLARMPQDNIYIYIYICCSLSNNTLLQHAA